MPSPRRLAACTGLLAILACLTLEARRAGAQAAVVPAPPPSEVDCGPVGVNVGDFLTFNVGNPGRPPQPPAVLLVRLLNSNGAPLLERQVTLAPGQSRTVRWPTANGVSSQVLVRGEVVVLSGPPELRVPSMIQIFRPDLTYGPHAVCSGGTGTRGPV